VVQEFELGSVIHGIPVFMDILPIERNINLSWCGYAITYYRKESNTGRQGKPLPGFPLRERRLRPKSGMLLHTARLPRRPKSRRFDSFLSVQFGIGGVPSRFILDT
jgi:hypothetical protein